jgi:hypothetical protein
VWSIVLATYTAPGDVEAATRTLGELPLLDPALRGAWLHRTTAGSMILYGRYEGPQSAAARRDLEWVEGLRLGGVPAFPKAMLTRVRPGGGQAVDDPMDLRSVRLRFPDVDPLYTLQVATWSDFESGALSLSQIHDRAEAYARELRARGFEAYYYHDDDKMVSHVTVGVFGRGALDPRSGFYSTEVESLLERFPQHLVNGEVFLEPISSVRPSLGTRVQKPPLVLVPKL